ncbi:MAG TPA: beta-ketoacyl-ACP synthase III [Pirellulaceae bacterium]|mgnify:CR=1 FL=1|nr:beta-ketoacyl-ACP synthase III [Pirellulaceae bacterium]HMO90812.1 beta-ketoacyl-ACP synthase III [Pirellulaceae bacterium]HMP68063.1 beta-ketoacyl-ACP synthase III [Pirellulaceae bacterium]
MAIIVPGTENHAAKPPLNRAATGIEIVATGSYAPANIVRNTDLAQLGCDEEWIVQRTGILERRHASNNEATSDLALAAARDCLRKANVAARDVDLILVATMTADHFTPSTASIVQSRLCSSAAAIDMNAACSGFMYGLITAAQFVKTGCYRQVLVIGADKMSAVIDPQDEKTYPLFGDAAGAALVRAHPQGNNGVGILAFRLASEGELGYLISVPGCGSRQPATANVLAERNQYLHMTGKPVFKWAVRIIPHAIDLVLSDAKLSLSDIDLLILHQANRRIVDAAVSQLDIPYEKVFVNLDKYGNTSAASIPLALDEAYQQGLVRKDGLVLMCGFGAGLTWGACIYKGCG